jgi:hypothetical protein
MGKTAHTGGEAIPMVVEENVSMTTTKQMEGNLIVSLNFDNKSVFIHVSKEPYENGEERGVYINLGGAINKAFYLAGRNSTPETASHKSEPAMPYSKSDVRANRYSGSGALTVEFKRRITTEAGKLAVDTVETPSILEQGDEYTLLPCDNNITLGSPEIASLVKPLFYQDNAHTLFIEPNVSERTIEEWPEWVTRTPQPEQYQQWPDWWKGIVVEPAIPIQKWPIPIDPRGPTWGPDSRINVNTEQDWLVNPGTGLLFDGELIAPRGRAQVAVLSSVEAAGALARGGLPVNVHAGSGLAPGRTVVAVAGDALDQAGLIQAAGGLNVVGSSGFNSALAQNFDALNRLGFGVVNPGGRLIRRRGQEGQI